MVVNIVLLELLARLVHIIDVRIDIRGVNLAATLIDGAEYRLDTRRGLRHERRGTRGGNGQHGDVATTHLDHLLVECRVGLLDAVNHRVVLLLLGVINLESTTLAGHLHRGTVGLHGQRLLHLDGKVNRLLRAVAQAQSGQHIALGRDTETRAATLEGHRANLVPQLNLHATYILVLGVGRNLLDNQLHLLQLQVDDVVHHAHRLLNVGLELVEVEVGILLEGVLYVAQQVDGQETARVVGTQGNLTAGVGRNGAEALVGIAVGDTLLENRIPEQHTRLGRTPSVVDNLLPKLLGLDFLLIFGLLGTNGELLRIFLVGNGGTHEVVVNLNRDVGTGHLARIHLGINETLGIGVLNRERKHQRTATAILCHLARRVRVTLHEGNDTGRGEGRVQNGATRGADVREVVTHTAATLHELHLLLVHAEDTAIRVGRIAVADDEAVRKRGNLEIVTDTGHRATLRNDVAEVVQEREDLLLRHGVRIFVLDALNLGSNALVHLLRRTLVNVAVGVLQSILAHPDRGGQVVTLEIDFRFGNRVVVINFLRYSSLDVFGHRKRWIFIVTLP